ncbi:MAG: hypothetical protein R3224_10150 [Balneolaceae bacterium]|nr:hypothetical protein [Balneolaceae bacterium]
MDIFKLFFEHDLRLDDLTERNTGKEPRTGNSIEAFMKPDPTYSKFYLTGTRLEEERFGLTVLEHYPAIVGVLENLFEKAHLRTAEGTHPTLSEAIDNLNLGEALLISVEPDLDLDPSSLKVEIDSNVGHFKSELREVLGEEIKVLYKENAHDGFDLHLFSKENIYRDLFYPLKELVGDSFRFFSINSKRVRSERQFYFETWSLEHPPHGAEEVLPETVL